MFFLEWRWGLSLTHGFSVFIFLHLTSLKFPKFNILKNKLTALHVQHTFEFPALMTSNSYSKSAVEK